MSSRTLRADFDGQIIENGRDESGRRKRDGVQGFEKLGLLRHTPNDRFRDRRRAALADDDWPLWAEAV